MIRKYPDKKKDKTQNHHHQGGQKSHLCRQYWGYKRRKGNRLRRRGGGLCWFPGAAVQLLHLELRRFIVSVLEDINMCVHTWVSMHTYIPCFLCWSRSNDTPVAISTEIYGWFLILLSDKMNQGSQEKWWIPGNMQDEPRASHSLGKWDDVKAAHPCQPHSDGVHQRDPETNSKSSLWPEWGIDLSNKLHTVVSDYHPNSKINIHKAMHI